MFRITGSTGFQIVFDNGITISVQFGRGNYCEHKMNKDLEFGRFIDNHESNDAEIALFDHNGNWVTKEAALAIGEDAYDDVLGWCDTAQVWKFMVWAQAQPKPILNALGCKEIPEDGIVHEVEIVD
jgi:hypothetical protein